MRGQSRNRLLVVMPNWLGDLIMATTVLEYLSNHSNSDIYILVRDSWSVLFENDCRIKEKIIYRRKERHRGIKGNYELSKLLKQYNFDSALLLTPSFRSAAVVAFSGIKNRIGFKCDMRSPFLTTGINKPAKGEQHYIDDMKLLVEAYLQSTVSNWPMPSLEYFIKKSDNKFPYWCIAVGSTYGDAKCWPVDKVRQLIEIAVNSEQKTVVLLGDKEASSAVRTLMECCCPKLSQFENLPGVIDYTGKTSLSEVTEIIANSELFIGNDSGLMHLSAAIGCPTVGVFGSTSTVWTSPKGRCTSTVSAEGFLCQPCFLRQCNEKSFCMDSITAEKVHQTAQRLISEEIRNEPS